MMSSPSAMPAAYRFALARWHAATRSRWIRPPPSAASLSTNASSGDGGPAGRPRRTVPVRLSKRMSELDLCSRREADRLIEAGRVRVRGDIVKPVLGQKIDPNELDIVILLATGGSDGSGVAAEATVRPLEFDWDRTKGSTVVLNKPVGYVSGQPDWDTIGGRGRHEPAVRLLTRANLHLWRDAQEGEEDRELRGILKDGNCLHFARRFGVEKSRRSNRDGSPGPNERTPRWDNDESDAPLALPALDATLCDYVPAGRLDLDSDGLLIFTKDGVMAKKLVSPHGLIEKEYLVKMEPVQSLTRVEREMGMTELPRPNRNLRPLLLGGARLFNSHRALRPVVEAEWLDGGSNAGSKEEVRGGTLRVVLKEGKKRQIRRMARELLGMHVISLTRTRIGDVRIDLPQGKWRPLREKEAASIFFAGRSMPN